jgi:hypothetical protein
MAEKRMFSMKIIDSDMFLEMPQSTQNLYFHLGMRADDDGFINNANKICKVIGASSDDLKLLIAKSFIIPFESGVIVIKHWRMNNYLRKDRYSTSSYLEEKSHLYVKENGAYSLQENLGIPLVDLIATQYREEEKKEENNNTIAKDVFDFWNEQDIFQHRSLTEEIQKVILQILKRYSLQEVKLGIERYSKIYHDTNYYFSYKWSLKDFLTRKNGISNFFDDGEKWVNYCSATPKQNHSTDCKVKEVSDGIFKI